MPENVIPMRQQADPLHPVEAEQQVLGAMLLRPEIIPMIVQAGGESLFHDPVHVKIFRAAHLKDRAGELISPVTLAAPLSNHLDQIGGPGYLARLAGASAASAALPGYISLLADARAKRGIAAAMSEASAALTDGTQKAGEIAARLEAALVATNPAGEVGPVSMLKAVTLAMAQVRAAYHGEQDHAVRSGIQSLDQMIGGFYPGELTLIGGRPSMGKTALSLSIALNAARAGHGVVIASLEMNPEAMALRALSEAVTSAGTATQYAKMRRGDLSDAQVSALRQAAKDVARLPIEFLPRDYADIGALFSGAKQVRRRMGEDMRLLVVDYAQLLRSSARSRYEQITEISIALKALAGNLNIPIIALSQLSRAVESREDKRPMLSDLRESGQLEQDADAIMFCFREEYYLERERPDDKDLEAFADWNAALTKVRNQMEIIVAKQRQGEIGTAHVRFSPATNTLWEDGFA